MLNYHTVHTISKAPDKNG